MKRYLIVPVLIVVAGLAMFAIRIAPPAAAQPSANVGSVAAPRTAVRFDDGLKVAEEAVCTRALAPRN